MSTDRSLSGFAMAEPRTVCGRHAELGNVALQSYRFPDYTVTGLDKTWLVQRPGGTWSLSPEAIAKLTVHWRGNDGQPLWDSRTWPMRPGEVQPAPAKMDESKSLSGFDIAAPNALSVDLALRQSMERIAELERENANLKSRIAQQSTALEECSHACAANAQRVLELESQLAAKPTNRRISGDDLSCWKVNDFDRPGNAVFTDPGGETHSARRLHDCATWIKNLVLAAAVELHQRYTATPAPVADGCLVATAEELKTAQRRVADLDARLTDSWSRINAANGEVPYRHMGKSLADVIKEMNLEYVTASGEKQKAYEELAAMRGKDVRRFEALLEYVLYRLEEMAKCAWVRDRPIKPREIKEFARHHRDCLKSAQEQSSLRQKMEAELAAMEGTEIDDLCTAELDARKKVRLGIKQASRGVTELPQVVQCMSCRHYDSDDSDGGLCGQHDIWVTPDETCPNAEAAQ